MSELGEPPDHAPPLTRGVQYIAPQSDEPPSPPPLVRRIASELDDRIPRHRRGPSPAVDGDEITRAWIRHPPNFTESPTLVTRELGRLTPDRSGSWSVSSDINAPSWWFSIPERLRTDAFWKHIFDQSEFFLVDKKIDPEKREAIDTIMGSLSIGYKGIYNMATRKQPLKSPFQKEVNVAFVKHYLKNVTPLSLTPEDRYRFEMMVMNFLMFAPMEELENYITRSRRGGKTRRRTRKHKSKRI